MTPHTPRLITAGLSGLALLSLSACGGGNSDEDNTAYDFHPETTVISAPEAVIELPEKLVELDESYLANRVAQRITVTPAEGSDGRCAVELDFTLTDTSQAALEDGLWQTFESDSTWRDIPEEDRYIAAVGHESTPAVVELPCATGPDDADATITLNLNELDESATKYPYSQAEYDYLDEETQELLDVQFDDELRWDVLDPFANVDVNITAEGEITVVDSEVKGYEYSGRSWQIDE